MKRMALGLALGLALTAASLTAYAEWEFREKIHPMTDENESWAFVRVSREEVLMVSCRGASDFYIFVRVGHAGGTPAFGRGAKVSYRVDSEPVVDAGEWNVSRDGTGAFAPDAEKRAFLEILKTASKLAIEVTILVPSRHPLPLKGHAVFEVSGASDAIGKLGCIK
jgi:hypothetical protein